MLRSGPRTSSPVASSLREVLPAVWSLALTVILLGPLLTSRGYLLLRDAVSTPRSFPTDSALGLTDAAARAVPQDALLAWLSTIVDGGVVVIAILTLSVWAAGFGASRLVAVLLPTAGTPARLVAVTVAIWNPYVTERLLQGHWSLLAGYAALPWTVCATTAIRRGARRGWWSLALCLAAAGLTPTGVLLAAVTALAVLAAPGGVPGRAACSVGAVALTAAAASPWLVATAVAGGGTAADPAGVRAFAARAEPGLGTLGSLAGLGGIWNADAVPPSRGTLWALVGTAALLAVVLCGLPSLWRRRRNPVLVAVAALAVVALAGPALGATAPGLAFGEWAMTHVPGAGLLRDSQKWVAWVMPLYVLAAAAGIGALRHPAPAHPARSRPSAPVRADAGWAVAAILVVLVALPDAVWGVGGRVAPVRYPESWRTVAEIVDDRSGDVAVLPAGMFRRFAYTGPAPVLDPAPRMLRADVLQTGTLVVEGGTVDGEGGRAREVEDLLLDGADPAELAARGVGWILVEHGTPGDAGRSQRTLDALEPVFSDGSLSLYRIDGPWVRESPGRVPAVAAHLLWLLLLAGGAVGAFVSHRGEGRRTAGIPREQA